MASGVRQSTWVSAAPGNVDIASSAAHPVEVLPGSANSDHKSYVFGFANPPGQASQNASSAA